MSITSFDITAAAASYSAVAALIAGFAFAVLVWIVERRASVGTDAGDGNLLDEALVFLALAFVGNVLVAFMWALISGEANIETNRPSLLSFIAGLIFSMIVPLTMQSMVYVVATTHSQRVIGLFRRIFFTSTIIGLAFQWTSSMGYVATLDRTLGVATMHPVFFGAVGPASFLILLAGGLISRRDRSTRFGLSSNRSFDWYVSVWLAAMLVMAVGFGYVSAAPPDATIPLWLAGTANIYWAIQVAWGILFLPN